MFILILFKFSIEPRQESSTSCLTPKKRWKIDVFLKKKTDFLIKWKIDFKIKMNEVLSKLSFTKEFGWIKNE